MNQIKYIFLLSALLFSSVVFAQIPALPGSNQGTIGSFPQNNANNAFPQPGQKKQDSSNGIDDSTKVIYGPKSTRYFLENDVVNNRKTLYEIDTLMDGGHNYNFLHRDGIYYQDLGLLGTAIRPVYYKAPEQVGTMLGYDAYKLYAFSPDKVKYYNTRSPFSNVRFVTGGGGQSILNFGFARNIDSLWNVGFEIQRITTDKILVDNSVRTGDKSLVGEWGFMIHSNYQTKNKKYQLLAHLNIADHNDNDQGGIALGTGSLLDALTFADNNAILSSANAISRDKWTNFHIYHEYAGYKAFQLFQSVDYQTRKVQFKDKSYTEGLVAGFYPKSYLDETQIPKDSLYNGSSFNIFEHKSGVKGFYNGFNYRLHLRQRFFTYDNLLNGKSISKNENFLGLWLSQNLSPSARFWGEAEFLVPFKAHQVKFEFQSKNLTLGFNQTSTLPTLVQQYIYNNSFRWDKDYSNVFVNSVYMNAPLKLGKLKITPSADIQLLSNYIYFASVRDSLVSLNSEIRPVQSAKDVTIFRAGLGIDYRIGRFSTVNQAYFTKRTGADVIRMPEILLNSRLAFDIVYAKVLFIQAGVEFNYKSGYYADAYMPAIQQFYVQNQNFVDGYLQADAFADFRINRVRMFIKMSHVNQGLMGIPNYFAAPLFPAVGRVFGFGVNWLLFD
ncbi:Putative porin [Pseudarcicella hirudinis]|uniref:Putative porin n=1 Tax=Pseudarcicella hirudinis TaxID=1079859 RepID=A0A1I5RMM7_9BACT|nr:putative porin [Pseudarcicella hirudinis]SFP59795.1 Putative porin [Pseudarcicella hirudinis]